MSLLPSDLWSVEFENSQYDLAYLGNVTHFFSLEENIRLFRKVFASLKPGGEIVVNSVARQEMDEVGFIDLWLYAATATGRAYGFRDYRGMLERAGYRDIRDINHGPIKARKP